MELNLKNRGEITILNDIILPLSKSKIICIVGNNDSGKTSLLETVRDFIKRRKISSAIVSQEDNFSKDIVWLELSSKKSRIIKSLLIAGLNESYLDRKIKTLSTSEKQRLKLAKALENNPKVLLVDDIFNSFDTSSNLEIIKLFKLMKNRYQKTIIITTTNTEIIHALADEVFLIDNGLLVFKGSKYELFENNELLDCYGIKCPEIIEFSNIVKAKKNLEIGYRDNINDLIKDIYRYVR